MKTFSLLKKKKKKLGTKNILGVLFACSFTKVQGIHRGKIYKTFLKDIKEDTPKNNVSEEERMCDSNHVQFQHELFIYLFIFKCLL